LKEIFPLILFKLFLLSAKLRNVTLQRAPRQLRVFTRTLMQSWLVKVCADHFFIYICEQVALWIKLETHSLYRRKQEPELARAPLEAAPTIFRCCLNHNNLILAPNEWDETAIARLQNILKRTVTSTWLGLYFRLWSSYCFLFLPFSCLAV